MAEKWSLEQVRPQPGRVALITGANSGIGYETALGLAMKDVEVILACRNMQKAEKARSSIVHTYPAARIECALLDTSSLDSVSVLATQIRKQYAKLDLLINNAGIMMSPYAVTKDGFENQLATNYLGHFALTGRLLPLLTSTPGSRVVTLSSLSYTWSDIDFADFPAPKRYSRRKAYGQSKRACLVFAYELHRRLRAAGYNTLSVAAHPGLSKTNLDQYFPSLIRPLGSLFLQPATQGALPVLYAALHQDVQSGDYIGPDGFQEMRGYPTKVDSDAHSKDKNIAERLWQVSEAMTNSYYLN